MRKALLGLAATAVVITLASQGSATPGTTPFAAPVTLTVDKGTGGYEPSISVDRFNNVFVTAHKQNHNLVLSPDSRAALGVRSQSWLWTSKDGKTFSDMPGLTPAQEQNMEFGDEGDIAVDETGHVYFVDTNVTDNSFSRYKATGNGQLALETTRPVGPFGEPVDDRPWIAAHGDGVVMYIGNQGDKVSYPAHLAKGGDGDAYGPGRYTVYMSYDHGDTFDPVGITLNDSGWCRPAADHRKGSKLLYVVCTNDGGADDTTTNAGAPGYEKGTLWSYVSRDDGKTWTRSKMGEYDARDKISTYPWVSVGPDGSVYALYIHSKSESGGFIEGDDVAFGNNPVDSRLHVYSSKSGGRTWTDRDVTAQKGMVRYSSIDVAPDGTVGIAYYFRPDKKSDWYLYAATAKGNQAFRPVKVSSKPVATSTFGSPLGDFFQVAFGPDNKLNVVWTSLNDDLGAEGLNSDILFARQK